MKRNPPSPATLQRPRIGDWASHGITAVQTAPIHEQVLNELRTAMMCGTFAPGEAITIRELARVFGVSPMPVRDALGRLVAEGALEMPNARSFRVPRMSYRQYIELCEFRALVESYALERAYTTSPASNLDETERLNESFAKALQRQDYADALIWGRRFMFSLYSGGSAEAILMPHIEKLWLRSGPLLPIRNHAMSRQPGGIEREVDVHRSVIAALREQQVSEAARRLRDDILDGYRVYLSEHDFQTEDGPPAA